MKQHIRTFTSEIQGAGQLLEWKNNNNFLQTFTERQCEFGHRAGSRSLMPVIVPMYLHRKDILVLYFEHPSTII